MNFCKVSGARIIHELLLCLSGKIRHTLMETEPVKKFAETKKFVKRIFQTSLLASSVLGLSDHTSIPAEHHKYIADLLSEDADSGQVLEFDNQITTSERKGFLDHIIVPLNAEAQRRRQERAESDPEFLKRVDPELNHGRVNFLLYGYGETHEPPRTERAFIGSLTIISIDVQSKMVDLISLTHDIRAPEVERYQKAKGNFEGYLIKIDKAYSLGGFDLMRETMEDATGLSVDFQIALRESKVAEIVDRVFGGIQVEVVEDFDATPFYLDGVKYPQDHFARGMQEMDGKRAVQFIKTVPIPKPGTAKYPAKLEHNARKHEVLKAMLRSLPKNALKVGFYVSAVNFLRQGSNSEINFDFDVKNLLTNNLLESFASVVSLIKSSDEEVFPEIRKTVYIVDSSQGDGGVRWVNSDPNPITRSEIRVGIYPDLATEVPYNANPNGDLVTEYWPSARKLVKSKLLE